MKRRLCLLFLLASVLCLSVSCVDPKKPESVETTDQIEFGTAEKDATRPQSTQPELPPDDNYTKIY